MFVTNLLEIDRVVSSPYRHQLCKEQFFSLRDPETDVSKISKPRSYCNYCTFSILLSTTCEKVNSPEFLFKKNNIKYILLFRILSITQNSSLVNSPIKLRVNKESYFWYWGYCSDTQPRYLRFRPLVHAWNSCYSVR